MTALSPALLPAGIGFLLAWHLIRKTRLRGKPLLLAGLGLPLGFGVTSLIMFWCYVLRPEHAKGAVLAAAWSAFCLLLALALLPFVLRSSAPRSPLAQHPPARPSGTAAWLLTAFMAALFVFFLADYWNYFLGKSAWNIFGGWDSRYFWNLKARFYFRSPEHWRSLFSLMDYTLPDYPHLLPAAVAWGWNWLGREFLAWPALIGFFFFLSTAAVIVWYLASFVSAPAALLGAAYFLCVEAFRFWSTTQYADTPLCFFFTAASCVLVAAVRMRDGKTFFLAGLLSGLSLWTKNEGVLFTACLSAAAAVALFTDRRYRMPERCLLLALFAAGAAIPLASSAAIKWSLGGGGIYLQASRPASDYLRSIFAPGKAGFIALCFPVFMASFEQWKGLWFIFLAALILAGRRRMKNGLWIFPSLVAAMCAGYYLVYLIAPLDTRLHVQTSLTRLLLHLGPMALIFSFEIFASPSKRHAGPESSPGPGLSGIDEGAQSLPLISMVMPSFNSERFIRQALDSILASRYPKLEIWVMDGASTDGTVEILKSYGEKVRWISQKDKGQSDALNRGFARARGEVIGWLNADDLLEPGALWTVGRRFAAQPDAMWLVGRCSIIDESGREIRRAVTAYKNYLLDRYSYRRLLTENFISQMGVFMRRAALDQAGPIDESLHYAMDYDLWLRLAKLFPPAILPERLAKFRMCGLTKSLTGFEKQFDEDYAVAGRHAARDRWALFWHAVNRRKIVLVYKILGLLRRGSH